MDALTSIVREAAANGERRLVLVTGLPGAGKTLVGLHSPTLPSWTTSPSSVPTGSRPPLPSSCRGMDRLSTVLQYELKAAGGGGKAFVRGVKQYVDEYTRYPNAIPPHHVLVFDEAQRAFNGEKVTKLYPSRTFRCRPSPSCSSNSRSGSLAGVW